MSSPIGFREFSKDELPQIYPTPCDEELIKAVQLGFIFALDRTC